jgi:Protein of unknown function (DUF669)
VKQKEKPHMPEYIQNTTSSEVLPDGSECDFIVENATEKESQAGNEMIELQLRILNVNGSDKGPLVYDNLVFTEKSYWKIDAFRECTGEKLVPGQRVVFNADDCIDRRGRVALKIDVYEGRSRNKVDYYILPNELPSASQTTRSSAGRPATAPPAAGLKNELGEPLNIPF